MCRFFSELNDTTLDQISRIGVKKAFRKDSVVMVEHDTGSALFVIVEGRVKISRVSDDGKEVILTILNESDFFSGKWQY